MKFGRLVQFIRCSGNRHLLFELRRIATRNAEPAHGSFPPAESARLLGRRRTCTVHQKIVVRLSEQRAYFYKGAHLVGESTISTVKPGFSVHRRFTTASSKRTRTMSREPSLFGDNTDDDGNVVKSNIDVRKDSKTARHSFPTARGCLTVRISTVATRCTRDMSRRMPRSHGCIRLPKGMAEHFFNAATEGTSVIVKE